MQQTLSRVVELWSCDIFFAFASFEKATCRKNGPGKYSGAFYKQKYNKDYCSIVFWNCDSKMFSFFF